MSEWIDHDGGPCPVALGTLVDIRTSGGAEVRIRATRAIAGNWYSSGLSPKTVIGGQDIVAYRVVPDGEPCFRVVPAPAS